jgi:acetyl-CoA carboxylase beta subunit
MSALNPEYIVKLSNTRKKVELPEVKCPRCQKILFEGHVEEYYSRCKNCKAWIHIKKK